MTPLPMRPASLLPTAPPPKRPRWGAAWGPPVSWREGERRRAEPGDMGTAPKPFPPVTGSLALPPWILTSLERHTSIPPCSETPLAFPHSVPFQMCSTVMVVPLPGPSTMRHMDLDSMVSMALSTAVSVLVWSLRWKS